MSFADKVMGKSNKTKTILNSGSIVRSRAWNSICFLPPACRANAKALAEGDRDKRRPHRAQHVHMGDTSPNN